MALAVAAWGIDASCSAGRGMGVLEVGEGDTCFTFPFLSTLDSALT